MKNEQQEHLNLLRSGLSLRKADYEHRKAMKQVDNAINELLEGVIYDGNK